MTHNYSFYIWAMNKIPLVLIYSRVLLAIVFGAFIFLDIPNKNNWLISIMYIGLLTDIFDGIVARKLNISTEKLRVLDSNVDQFFWLIIIGSTFYLNSSFFKTNYLLLLVILVLELATYILSFVRFGKTIATHSLLAKLWTISIVVFLTDLILSQNSTWIFYICFGIGVLSRLEILAIIISLKKWVTDVPSILVVGKINRGEPIKKNTLFNS